MLAGYTNGATRTVAGDSSTTTCCTPAGSRAARGDHTHSTTTTSTTTTTSVDTVAHLLVGVAEKDLAQLGDFILRHPHSKEAVGEEVALERLRHVVLRRGTPAQGSGGK
eukprot:1184560-Prorocentrum_minimum.AAC.2